MRTAIFLSGVITHAVSAFLFVGPLLAGPPEFAVEELGRANVEYFLYSTPTAVSWSPASPIEESILAIGTADGVVTLRKVPSGHEYLRLESGYRVPITNLSFSSDGRLLAASSPVERFSTIWDLKKRSEVNLSEIRRAHLIVFSPTQPDTFAAVGPAGRITIGEIGGSDSFQFRTGHETIPTRLDWSEDGSEVLAAYPQISIVGSASDAGKNRTIPCQARNDLLQDCGLATWVGANGKQVLQVSSSGAGGQTSLVLEGQAVLAEQDSANKLDAELSSDVAWSSTRQLLLVGGSQISILDITIFDKAIPLRPMGEPDVHYSKMSLDPSQTILAVVARASADPPRVELWDLSSGAQLHSYLPGTLNGHNPNNDKFTASMYAATVGTIQQGQPKITMWQESTGGPRQFRDPIETYIPGESPESGEPLGLPASVGLSSDGNLLAIGHPVGRVSVWKRNSGELELAVTNRELRFIDSSQADRRRSLTTKITAIEFAEDSQGAWILSSPNGQGSAIRGFPSSFVTNHELLTDGLAILLPLLPGDVEPSFEPKESLSALALSVNQGLAFGALASRSGPETPLVARWRFDTSTRRATLDVIRRADSRCSSVLDIRITPDLSYVCPEGLSFRGGWIPLPLRSVSSAQFFKSDSLALGVHGHLLLAAIHRDSIQPESLLIGGISEMPLKSTWMVCALSDSTCWGTDDGTLLVKNENSLVVPFRRKVKSRRDLECAGNIVPVGQALREGGNSHAFSVPISAEGYALWPHFSLGLRETDSPRWAAVGMSKVDCLNCSISDASATLESRLVLTKDWNGNSLREIRARLRWWNPCESGWHQSKEFSLPIAPPFLLPSFPDVELADVDGTLALKLSRAGKGTPFYHSASLPMGIEESGILVAPDEHETIASSGQSLHPLPWERGINAPLRVSSREAVPPYRSRVLVLNDQKPPFVAIAAIVVGAAALLSLLWHFLGRPHRMKAN